MLKPLRKSDTFETFSRRDPSLDLDGMNNEEKKELDRLLVLKPSEAWKAAKIKKGEDLTRFRMGVIMPDAMCRITDQYEHGSDGQYWRAFCESFVSVDGFGDVPKEDGKVSESWIKETFIQGLYGIALELGSRALAWNRLTEDERKNLYGRSKRENISTAQTAEAATTGSESKEAA